ncbi:MAG TPA: GIY-YIG nuclease family protein [Syntrophomonadaceae bacterium]|nr:GIY-YIG nuclease family protein [Syntrophomonadaceae bacterium]HQA08431.1 GIY-YIG nuclease family protein [Syntrophomonadaceae bacterium]HQE24113.1 GIY-YIG nuclease family protein [Syntrophomonadaceae bacterium]
MAFVYMVRCRDNTLYTGYAEDLDKRIAHHNAGKASKYTRTRLPVELVYYEEVADQSSALRRELQIKQMSRSNKESLIKTFQKTKNESNRST